MCPDTCKGSTPAVPERCPTSRCSGRAHRSLRSLSRPPLNGDIVRRTVTVTAIDAPLFRATLKEELLEAWRALKAAHPDEHFYSFGVDIGACAEYFIVTASTEEGLAQVAARYVEKDGG